MDKFIAHLESYVESITKNKNKLEQDITVNMPGIVNPIFTSKNIGVFDGFYDLMSIPIKYGFEGDRVAYISENANGKNKYIFITTYFTEIYKKLGIGHTEKELLFVYLHELMHERFHHLYKYKQYTNIYPMPQIVYNIAFDIFVNTLLKYFPNRDFKTSQLYKSSCRYYENKSDMEENFTRLNEKFDLQMSKKDLAMNNVLLNKEIEKLSDTELVQVLYSLFKDFFDKYDQLASDTIQEYFAQLEDDQNNDTNSSSAGDGSNSKSSFNGSGSKSASGASKNQKEIKKSLDEMLENKIKEELSNNAEFKEAFKRYASNFSNLPTINLDYGTTPGEPSVQEKAKIIKASQTAQKIIEDIKKDIGTVPGFLRGFADLDQEVPDYMELLQGFAQRFIGTDRGTYSPPNKKVGGNLIMPSFVDNSVKLLFVVDTSGSIRNETIGRVISHIKGILDSFEMSELYVAYNDVTFNIKYVTSLNDLEESLKEGVYGGGGSDFSEVFKTPETAEVDAIIFMSDFYITFDDIEITKPIIILQDKMYCEKTLNKFLEHCENYISLPLYPELA
jgi:predicted metal-dependent peptidase